MFKFETYKQFYEIFYNDKRDIGVNDIIAKNIYKL